MPLIDRIAAALAIARPEGLLAGDLVEGSESPLRQAPDAELLDTSYMTIDEQVEFVLDKVARKVLTKEFSEQE